jgi:cyclase
LLGDVGRPRRPCAPSTSAGSAHLDEHARIAQNVLAVYYELDPAPARVETIEVFRRMAELEGFTE